MRLTRGWRWALVLALATLAAVGTIVVLQPPWSIDVAAWVAPDMVWRVETTQPLVALTFDDGPVPGQTSVALDLLARHHARATFFMIGERAAAHPELVEKVRRGGHEVGNHAYADRRTLGLPEEEFRADLLRTEEVLGLKGRIKVYRPPSGLISPTQLAIVRGQGYRCVMGSAYPYDPMGPPASYIRWLVTKNLAPGVIVALHDGIPEASETLDALEGILEAGERKGLRFVTVSELLAASSAAR
jgi:peptidoglycan/xylan/chitin deacetylase (PgdA/CDA1 family)